MISVFLDGSALELAGDALVSFLAFARYEPAVDKDLDTVETRKHVDEEVETSEADQRDSEGL